MSRTAEDTITPKVANHALHYFHSDEGFIGGAYFDCLFRLAALADTEHLEKLANEYPAEIAAFHLARFPGGIQTLRIMASLPLAVNV